MAVMVSCICQLGQEKSSVTQSNVNLGVAVKIFIDMIKVHNQVTLSKGDYPR